MQGEEDNEGEVLKENVDPLSKMDIISPDIYEHKSEDIDFESPLKKAKLSANDKESISSEGLGSLESKEERAKRKQAEDMLWELCQNCDAHLVRVTRKPGRGRRRKISPDQEAALKAIPSVIHLHGKGQSSSRITIGRQSNLVDVVIEPVVKGVSEYIISRRHAVVEKKRVDENNGDFLWMIEDTNSLNGVFVNNVKRKKCVLNDDDTVVFGGGGSLKDGEKLVQNDSKFIYKFKLMKNVKNSNNPGDIAELTSPKRAKTKRRRKTAAKNFGENTSDKSSGKFDEQISSIIKEVQKQRAALLTVEKAIVNLSAVQREPESDKSLSSSDAHAVSLFGAELYCSLCSDLFVDPIVVPCGHSFCRACILERIVGGNSRCPACSAKFGGVADLYPALTVVSCVRVCVGLLPDNDKTLYESRLKAYGLKTQKLLENVISVDERTMKSDAVCDGKHVNDNNDSIVNNNGNDDDKCMKESEDINENNNDNDNIPNEKPSQKLNSKKPVPQQDDAQKKVQPLSQSQSQQQASQKSDNSQKSPKKAKTLRSSQASPKTPGKKKKKTSPQKTKKQQPQQQQQQQQPQVDDAVRAKRLREAIEKAKKKGTKFLDITEPWEDDDKQTFLKGLSNYSSPLLRTIYCEMIGLTQEWVETTGVKDMLTAVNNLSLNCDASNIQELRKVLNEYISCGGQHKISSFFKAI